MAIFQYVLCYIASINKFLPKLQKILFHALSLILRIYALLHYKGILSYMIMYFIYFNVINSSFLHKQLDNNKLKHIELCQ
jgi:hypothetical protein